MTQNNWVEIAASTAQALIAYGLMADRAKRHFPINYEETRFVCELWGSKRSEGQWGTRVSIALDVGNLQDHESPIVAKKLLVLADDFQPWGDGNEIPVILVTFDLDNIVGASQAAQHAFSSDLSERFDQLIENEETGHYEIQRA